MKTIKSTIKPPRFSCDFPQGIENIAFFDIETTGLSAKASSLYLLGVLYFDSKDKQWQLIQWFANDYQSEKKILEAFLGFLEHFQCLFHFNGKTFDIPYITQKCRRHAISISRHNALLLEDTDDVCSIDLLQHIRRLRHVLQLEKCKQAAVENWLGCRRTDPFSGGDLVPVYSEYMQQKILAPEKAEALEKTLLLHNHDDVAMMLELCSILNYEKYFLHPKCNPIFGADCLSHGTFTIEKDRLSITLPAALSVPRKLTLSARYPEPLSSEGSPADYPALSPATVTVDDSECLITIPLYRGCLKYFYDNPKDYYYLPEEDMAIHKSVAEFVEKEYRKKATAATCYNKLKGIFLPRLAPCRRKKKTEEAQNELPHFFFSYKDRLSFLQLPENFQENPTFWQAFLPVELKSFL